MSTQVPPLEWTEEQQDVLRSTARLRVVRACPGSGKTTLFVEMLRRFMQAQQRRAVAALSFTNVAQNEINNRIGAYSSPDFIGTLDSFMLRFVVRPFGHLVGVTPNGARLIPSPLDEAIERPEVQIGPRPFDKASVFAAQLVGERNGVPEIVARRANWGRQSVPDLYAKRILRCKRGIWAKSGLITHADCHFLASQILCHPHHGHAVVPILARRFPIVLVDEFQDTSYFLGKALLRILADPLVTGVVVGDADQAIFAFGGASPALFDDVEKLPGCATFNLVQTQRCSRRVAAAASMLSQSGITLVPCGDALEGRCLLLTHSCDRGSVDGASLSEALDAVKGDRPVAILARRGATVIGLQSIGVLTNPPAGMSHVARRILRAVELLRQGDSAAAKQLVAEDLLRIVLNVAWPSADEMRDVGHDAVRFAVFRLLRQADSFVSGESWNGWIQRIREEFRRQAVTLGWEPDDRILGQKLRASPQGNVPRPENRTGRLPRFANVRLTTVHKVKGEEFESVIFFAPKPHGQYDRCISSEWWSDSEERRVAFVAVSRAKTNFVLCVHPKTYSALKRARPDFVQLFEDRSRIGNAATA